MRARTLVYLCEGEEKMKYPELCPDKVAISPNLCYQTCDQYYECVDKVLKSGASLLRLNRSQYLCAEEKK